MRATKAAFTLVELLVVITVIVVLLALLAPAMDKAIYQAELAGCAAQLRGIGTSVQGYALDHKRRYPYRAGVVEHHTGNGAVAAAWRPNALKGDGRAITNPWDDRPLYKTFMSLKLLLCPLSAKFDPDSPDTYGAEDLVYASYQLWFGWGYNYGTATAQKGMFRVGDRFQWGDDRFDLLASDRDEYDVGNGTSYADTSHADEAGALASFNHNGRQFAGSTLNTNFHSSGWNNWATQQQRGTIDMNFVHHDLSVSRENKLAHDDPRLVAVPLYAKTSSEFPVRGVRLPTP